VGLPATLPTLRIALLGAGTAPISGVVASAQGGVPVMFHKQ
jgi:hypothetical protein